MATMLGEDLPIKQSVKAAYIPNAAQPINLGVRETTVEPTLLDQVQATRQTLLQIRDRLSVLMDPPVPQVAEPGIDRTADSLREEIHLTQMLAHGLLAKVDELQTCIGRL